jgi:hypothetical protein
MDNPNKEEKEDLKGLYDLVVPLSTPITVIRELVERFELDPVRRKGKMDMTGEVMEREILVLRGDLETVMAAKKYMFEAVDKKINEWESKEKSDKYKKFYEARIKEKAETKKEAGESADAGCETFDWTNVRD